MSDDIERKKLRLLITLSCVGVAFLAFLIKLCIYWRKLSIRENKSISRLLLDKLLDTKRLFIDTEAYTTRPVPPLGVIVPPTKFGGKQIQTLEGDWGKRFLDANGKVLPEVLKDAKDNAPVDTFDTE